jgi:hypothetical protein
MADAVLRQMKCIEEGEFVINRMSVLPTLERIM